MIIVEFLNAGILNTRYQIRNTSSWYNQFMKKYNVFLIAVIVLFLAGAFGWALFSKKKTVNIISNQQSAISNQEQENNEQETVNSEQEIADNEPETATDDQEKADSDQSSAISNQKTENSKQSDTKQETQTSSKIISRLVSFGFEKVSNRKIDTIIIHSSYDAIGKDPYSIDGIIAEYKEYGVAAHYLIGRDGKTYQLVENKNIAYHAGVSKVPDGRTGVNAFSIGIEMVNMQDGKFTDAQYSALNSLIKDLKKQYSIKYILGHSDIAPGRKTDPWGMEWDNLKF